PSGMQIENPQPWIVTLSLACREKTAAIGERKQITHLRAIPAGHGDPLGQSAVEQVAAAGREQPRTQVALRRQLPAGGEFTGAVQIATFVAEALQTEIVGYALTPDTLQTGVERRTLTAQLRQAQGETVGRMGTALQFALVTTAPEDLQAFVLRGGQLRIALAWQVQAEPLTGQRLAVLQPRVADHLQWHPGGSRDAPGGFLGVEVALFHPQPQVLAFTGQSDVQHLVDLKVLGHGLQHRAAARLTMRPRP